ncbi:hypothetical protein [uncultured Muribaculum sp.]|uniref:hypothetical protein n=2 Tax=uncultured Muribaculum sp. TaxID=1918613 RepID=UPI0025B1BA8C|nr:hypothetical protein [uncultured Muribaculum sp.]
MSVFGAVFNTFATNSSKGTVYMTRDFAMSFCDPYISADNGNLKLNLTAEEAAAMGLNPKDYAEIVRNNQGVSPFLYEQISRMVKSMNENHPNAGEPQIMKLSNEPAS